MKSKTLFSLLAATGAFLHAEISSAQTAPPSVRTPEADNTLGTQVSGNGNNFDITGGLNRGQTLFHSFKDFSIPTGGAANFNNPAGTRDIISRVTGNLFSDINGTLNSNGANFLLINPNGVVFGPNAKLNVGKAFAASTASGVDLVDGQGRQITFGTNPNGDAPLLTINPNVFFNVSRLNMGANVPNSPGIVNYGTLQTNNDSQYIGLIGGNVKLDGGKVIAPGGRVDLGGLNSAGTVSTDSQGLVFGGSGLVRGDVLLTNGASVSARANGTLDTVKPFFSNLAFTGSNININANNLNILNSGARSNTGLAALDSGLELDSGVKTNPGGDININATGLVNLDNANIKNTLRSGAEGKIGDIKINANSLNLINRSLLSTNTSGKGDAGNIDIKTTGDISISGTTPQSTQVPSIDNQSAIFSNTDGQGNAGKITIDTQNRGKLLLSNRAAINNSIDKDAVGNSKGIEISAQSVDLRNGGFIFSDNDGQGNAGNISIKTIGDISLSGTNTPSTLSITQEDPKSLVLSTISSSTDGKGNAGKITIDTQNQGKFSLSDRANIVNSIDENGVGNGNEINISAREVDIRNEGFIVSDNRGGKGDAGNINIKTTGDISISGSNSPSTALVTDKSKRSFISSSTDGQGNAGKITIDTQNQGKFSLNEASIISTIDEKAVGNGRGISISAREIDLRNGSFIFSDNFGGMGDTSSIDLKTTGDISISGSTPNSTALITENSNLSSISSATNGKGNAGKITIDTQNLGKLSLSNNTNISNTIDKNAVGDSNGIAISAREIDIRNKGSISSTNRGKGNAGNIDINTIGDISISGSTPDSTAPITDNSNLSSISSESNAQGNAGKININTQNRGKLSLSNDAIIATTTSKDAVGNGGDITILAREFDLRNEGFIGSATFGKGDAGNISIKTIGDISISNAFISSNTIGQGNAGKITIDTQNRGRLSLDRASISSTVAKTAVGKSNGIKISARAIDLKNTSLILSNNFGGLGTAGDISIDSTGDLKLANNSSIASSNIDSTDTPTTNIKGDAGNISINAKGDVGLTDKSFISSTNLGEGKTGDISLNSDRVTLNNSFIEAISGGATGGNIQLTTLDKLLLRNTSRINTTSDSTGQNGNGGNISINSPLIIALTGGNNANNAITANAKAGNGGKVNIISNGLFGIKYRPKGQDSLFTNDITSSSTFGQSGVVDIKTPGTDPGKDSTVLPNVPTDASNQIAQTCNADRENKFIIAGRGGLPPNADDPLTSDVVWQDSRAANSQPTAGSATTDDRNKLPPPAVGLVVDGKGKAYLIAAGSQGQPTKTTVTCPNVVKK